MKQTKMNSLVSVVLTIAGSLFPFLANAQISVSNNEMDENDLWNANKSEWESAYIASKFGGSRLELSDLDMSTDYFMVDFSDEGLAAVLKNGKEGFVNTKGEVVIPFIYEWVRGFSEGLAAVCNDSHHWGFINTRGEVVIPLIYDWVQSFSEGLAAVSKNGKDGFINTSGDVVVPMIYDSARSFSDGLAAVRKDEKWGFVDTTGNLVFPCNYYSCGSDYTDEDHDFDTSDEELYMWDGEYTGGEAWAPRYDEDGVYNYISSFHEGIALFVKKIVNNCNSRIEKKFIDKSGKTVFTLNGYNNAGNFNEGLARVSKKFAKGHRIGYIDQSGKEIIPCVYDFAGDFHDGLARVGKRTNGNNKFGFIDQTGNEVIPCIYDGVSSFHNGQALVKTNLRLANERGYEWKYIDETGKTIKVFKTGFHKLLPADAAFAVDAADAAIDAAMKKAQGK